LLLAHGFLYTDAFPNGNGELAIAAGYGDHYIEVIIDSDANTFSVAYDFERKRVFYRLRRSREEAEHIVLEIAGKLWSAYISFIQGNTIQPKTSGPDSLSRTIMVHYRLSDVNALLTQEFLSVNTFVNILENSKVFQANHQYFGSLELTPFRLEVS
jgi:hypothetical protein